MRTLALLLFLFAPSLSAQTVFWRGTNDAYAVQIATEGISSTNHGDAKVWITVNGKVQNQPARVYVGADGWRTLDYGKDVYPERIAQFKILAVRSSTMIVSNDNGKRFVLYRQ